MGKFFNGQVKKDRTTLIRYIIIGCGVFFIILLFILIAAKSNKPPSNVVLTPKDSLTLEVNSNWPEAVDFFDKIENYDTDDLSVTYNDLDMAKVGEYTVTLNADGYNSVDVKVKVTDTKPPELTLRELQINYGDVYKIDDFVVYCEDNSKELCTIDYYQKSQDQNGMLIDYSSFTQEGTYLIKIVAKDESGNETEVKETKLTIGQGTSPVTPTNCIYGGLNVSSSNVDYPIAVIVGDQLSNCALNRDLWDDKNGVQEPVDKFFNDDYAALKTDIDATLKTEFPKGAKIIVYPTYKAVLNDEAKGLVGYGIHVVVYIASQDYADNIATEENKVLEYYIKPDHTRQYIVNKYNLR